MSSVSAQRSCGIFWRTTPHSAAKAGVLGTLRRLWLMSWVRIESVRIVSHPGSIQTDITGDKLNAAMKADIIKGISLDRLGRKEGMLKFEH